MDMMCPKCGEPWDNDSLHEEASESHRTYKDVSRDFQVRGCEALTTFGVSHNSDTTASPVIAALYDLLGDDTDGAMSELEDAERWGLL